MKVEPKVVAAIAGAIDLYLQSEIEEARVVEDKFAQVAAKSVIAYGISPWALAGRHSAMEMRRLLQMRLVR